MMLMAKINTQFFGGTKPISLLEIMREIEEEERNSNV